MRLLYTCTILFFVLSLASISNAQSVPGDQIKVYLVTFGPGSDPWEKFGHDCILIQNPEYTPDAAYNWGMFSFGEGIRGALSFGLEFLHGRLMYSMGAEDASPMLANYEAVGRSVLIQQLDLTPAAKLDLQTRLMANDTDANRNYLYDYFKKNCATMCRDQINQAVNGQLAKALKKIPTGTTYRWQDKRVTADTLWLYYFLDFSLGHAVDQPLSAWQESFLPEKLAQNLRTVKVTNAAGQSVPLVKREKQSGPGIYPQRESPPSNYFYGFAIAGLLTGMVILSTILFGLRFRPLRWLFILISMAWSLLTGLLGALLTYAWFSDHAAAKWNENWLQGNPLSLLLLVCLPIYFRWPLLTKWTALAILGLSAGGLVAKITPWAWQVNGAIIASMLPVHAAVFVGVIGLIKRAGEHHKSYQNLNQAQS